eukprot:jgi/Botrbrau1/6707/Bobra.0202s0042.1
MALRQLVGSIRRSDLCFPFVNRLSSLGREVSSTAQPLFAAASDTPEPAPGKGAGAGWGQTKISQVLGSKERGEAAWLYCLKDDYVIEAVRKMAQSNVGSLLVFDPTKAPTGKEVTSAAADAVVGIVTERDYLTKVVVQGKSSASLAVADIMTGKSQLLTVSPQTSVLQVMELMIDKNIRHVPVVENDEYMGMISIRDVVSIMVAEHREEVGRLQEYIQGSY